MTQYTIISEPPVREDDFETKLAKAMLAASVKDADLEWVYREGLTCSECCILSGIDGDMFRRKFPALLQEHAINLERKINKLKASRSKADGSDKLGRDKKKEITKKIEWLRREILLIRRRRLLALEEVAKMERGEPIDFRTETEVIDG